MTAATLPQPVLIDLVASKRFLGINLRSLLGVTFFAMLTAVLAQVSIPLSFTPVPITGQTLAVLLSGAALGPRLGSASQLLYIGLGAAGFSVFADRGSGITSSGPNGAELIPTFGYLVGFVVAAYIVGVMAKRGQDRSAFSAIPAFLAGSVVIYIFGATFLSYSLDVPFAAPLDEASALAFGIAPFVIGDVLKALVAGLALPAAWKLFGSSYS